MELEAALEELLFEVSEAIGSTVIDSVTGFFPAYTITSMLIRKGLMKDYGHGKPTKRQVNYVRNGLGAMTSVARRRVGKRTYYRSQ